VTGGKTLKVQSQAAESRLGPHREEKFVVKHQFLPTLDACCKRKILHNGVRN